MAVVDPSVQVGQDVYIGPFCVVESGVVLGDRCHLAGHVTVKEGTILGTDNEIAENATLGGTAQHLAKHTASGKLIIGNANRIR